jgi:hypothetical protein
MVSLRSAITGARFAAGPGGAAAGGQSGSASLPRPLRLRRRPAPGLTWSAGRHHRSADPGSGRAPVRPALPGRDLSSGRLGAPWSVRKK